MFYRSHVLFAFLSLCAELLPPPVGCAGGVSASRPRRAPRAHPASAEAPAGCRGRLQSLSRTNRLSPSPDSSQGPGRRGWWQLSVLGPPQPARPGTPGQAEGEQRAQPGLARAPRAAAGQGTLLVGRYTMNSQTTEAVSFSFL